MNDHMTVIMKPTNQCNLRCKYCYHAENGYSNDKMSEATLQKTIAVTAPFVKHITYNWHGGEPLMMGLDFYRKAIFYQNKFKRPNQIIRNTIQTNGTLLTDDFASFFKKNNFGVGISYDGPFNDSVRGSTNKTLFGYSNVLNADISCGTITVIGEHNINNLTDIYEYFKKRHISFKIAPMFNSGAAKENSELLINSPESYGNAVMALFDYWIKDKTGDISIRPLDKYIHSYFVKRMRSCTRNNCMYHMVSVYSDGSVYPCGKSYSKEYCIGNISNVSDINQLFNNSIYQNIASSRSKRNEYCSKNCDIYDYCRAGCNNDSIIAGDLTKPDKFQCVYHKMLLEHIHSIVRSYLNKNITIENQVVKKHIQKFQNKIVN